jgi:hypothetical protein
MAKRSFIQVDGLPATPLELSAKAQVDKGSQYQDMKFKHSPENICKLTIASAKKIPSVSRTMLFRSFHPTIPLAFPYAFALRSNFADQFQGNQRLHVFQV